MGTVLTLREEIEGLEMWPRFIAGVLEQLMDAPYTIREGAITDRLADYLAKLGR